MLGTAALRHERSFRNDSFREQGPAGTRASHYEVVLARPVTPAAGVAHVRVYLLRANHLAGRSSDCIGCEGAFSICGRSHLSVLSAMVCNILRSILLSALPSNSSIIKGPSGIL
jgi:hypothetical protein